VAVTLSQYSELVASIYAAALDEPQTDLLPRQDRRKSRGSPDFPCGDQMDVPLRLLAKGCRHVSGGRCGIDPTARSPQTASLHLPLIRAVTTAADIGQVASPSDGVLSHGGISAAFLNRFDTQLESKVFGTRGDAKSLATFDRLALLKLLDPHVELALEVQRSIADLYAECFCAFEALDHLRLNLVVVNQSGWVLFLDRAAAEIEVQADGLSFVGRLRATSRSDDAILQKIIRNATSRADHVPKPGIAMISRPSGRRSFVVRAFPLCGANSTTGHRRAVVLLQISDPECESHIPPFYLQETFGLTPTEAKVAICILRGSGLPCVAKELSVTLSTVRVHLQRVFEKTGTHRQAELVRLLLAMGAVA
jgi:DNA-binding CsgD family transcriptional regulator